MRKIIAVIIGVMVIFDGIVYADEYKVYCKAKLRPPLFFQERGYYKLMLEEEFGYEWPVNITKPRRVSARELYRRLCELRNRTGLTEETRFNRFSGGIIARLEREEKAVMVFLDSFQIASNGLERLGINTRDRRYLFNRFYRYLLQTSDFITTLMILKSLLEASFPKDEDRDRVISIFQSRLLPYVINKEEGDLEKTAKWLDTIISFSRYEVKDEDRLKFFQVLVTYNFLRQVHSEERLLRLCLEEVNHIVAHPLATKSLSDRGRADASMATMRALLHIDRRSLESGLESFQEMLDSLNDDLRNKVSKCSGLKLVYTGITPWDRYFFTDLLNSLDKIEKEKLIRVILINRNFIIKKETEVSYSIINISAAYNVMDANRDSFPKRLWQTSDNTFRSWLLKNIKGCLDTKQGYGLLRGFHRDIVTRNPRFDFSKASPLEPPVELGPLARTWAREIERICDVKITSFLERASVEAVERQPQTQCL